MKLTSMKNESAGKDFDCCSPCYGPSEAYPYGLNIYLSSDACQKLGLGALKPGTKVNLQAVAVVTSSSQDLSHEGTETRLSLQITDMGAESGGTLANAAEVLYPKS